MSNTSVHGFDIPHEHVQPTRDMVVIQIPMPPSKSKGGIITPDMTRDLLAHNVMAGRITKMGPLAFTYKDADGLQKQEAKIGDWALIRPFAGTMIQGGTIMVNCGYRYISSFQDIIGIIPASQMPLPSELEWEVNATPDVEKAPGFDFDNPREKIAVSGA